jgi:hypothetical protein
MLRLVYLRTGKGVWLAKSSLEEKGVQERVMVVIS